jgi:DNA-directed RNA polymerase specialized sigma subunit
LAQLFERQRSETFRGWMRACLDHFIRRYREADQEAANADYKPVFLEADRATVEVKLARPRRMERPLNTHVRPVSLDQPITTVDADGPNDPLTLKDIIADTDRTGGVDTLKDKADALLPRLKGNERAVFEALLTGDPTTTQRDIAKATGLAEGAVSKILRRITRVAQK